MVPSSCPGWPGSTWTSTVEAVPGDDDGLRWRTRLQCASTPDGRRGHAQAPLARRGPGRRLPDRPHATPGERRRPGDCVVGDRRARTTFEVAADGFWQVHPGAPRIAGRRPCSRCSRRSRGRRRSTCTPASGCSPRSSPTRVGASAAGCVAVEGDRTAVRARRGNLRRPARASRRSAGSRRAACSATGVRRAVRPGRARPAARGRRAASSSSRSSTARPRAVAYVACDPAALARDVAIFAEHGYRLARAAGLRPVPDDAPRRVRRAAATPLR